MLFGMGWFSHCSCCTMTPPKRRCNKIYEKVCFIILYYSDSPSKSDNDEIEWYELLWWSGILPWLAHADLRTARVDPFAPNRVWWTVRGNGTHTGSSSRSVFVGSHGELVPQRHMRPLDVGQPPQWWPFNKLNLLNHVMLFYFRKTLAKDM